MRQRVVFLVLLLQSVYGLKVHINYSFRLPKLFGVADPKEVCCPYARLPKNNTNGMMPPTIIGIGTQKGGTSTFYVHLRTHPQLQSTNKELHYLDEVGSETYRHYLQRWPFNKALMRHKFGRNRGRLLMTEYQAPQLFEISPSYMFVPFAACKSKWISPNAKFVVFLREPADRAYSGVTHETNAMSRAHGGKYRWMHRTFKEHMLHGIQELILDPKCDFHTGKGRRTYNDCVGCMVRWIEVQESCAVRPFVNLVDSDRKHTCTSIGKEHVLRGLYGPQLAWWFTMFDPSQFKIINSNTYFKDPLTVMKNITSFLGLTRPYTSSMLKRAPKKANVGHYWKVNKTMIEETKSILREFYKRPNLELYRLLEETGHRDFPPFEDYLQDRDVLDCRDAKTIESGICGVQLFGDGKSMYTLIESSKREKKEHLLRERKMEKPQETSQQEVEFSEGVTVVRNPPDPEDASQDTPSESKSASRNPWPKNKPINIAQAVGFTRSFPDQKSPEDNQDIPKFSQTGYIEKEAMKSSSIGVQSMQGNEIQTGDGQAPTIFWRSSSVYSSSRQPVRQLGISSSDFIVHFIFGAFLVGVSLYGFRNLRRNRRRE